MTKDTRWAIFDIDGVLSNCVKRVPLAHAAKACPAGPERDAAWAKFHETAYMDHPHEAECMIAHAWLKAGHRIAYLTGRPDTYRDQTQAWLRNVGLTRTPIFMRPDANHEPAVDFKRSQIEPIRDLVAHFDGEIMFVMEDQQEIVDMWRAEGFTCLQPRVWTANS